MELTLLRNDQIVTYLVLVVGLTQALFTLLSRTGVGPQRFLWRLEVILFTILATFAGAALVQAKKYHLGWSAIAYSSVFNLVQVSIGLTLFQPFGGVSRSVEGAAPLFGGILEFSFVIYYAAKILLGLAALVFGTGKARTDGVVSKGLGGLTALAGVFAIFANFILVVVGRDGFLPSAVAGASGVVATVLLALCLITMVHQKDEDGSERTPESADKNSTGEVTDLKDSHA